MPAAAPCGRDDDNLSPGSRDVNKVLPMAVLLLALAASMAAAGNGEIIVGGAAGAGIPTGDFGDVADAGFSGGVFGEYMVTPNLGLGVDAMFHGPGGSESYINTLPFSIDDVTFEIMQFTAHGRWVFMPEQSVTPYAVVGGGVYNFKTNYHGSGVSDNISTKGGIFGGVGADYKLTSMIRIGAEGVWHDVFTPVNSSQMFTLLGRVSLAFPVQVK
jgi:hypothetical protein